MTATTYLYKRPAHSILRIVDNDPVTNTPIVKQEHYVSAFNGIDLAVRAVSMNSGHLAEALRIIRKLEKASHRDVKLHAQYVEFSAQEKKIIEDSVLGFDWSKFCTQNNTTLWTNWIGFLEGFIPETETYAKTWLEFDPKNPPSEYAAWLLEHEKNIAAYEAEVRAATEAAAKHAEAPKQDNGVVEGDFTPAA